MFFQDPAFSYLPSKRVSVSIMLHNSTERLGKLGGEKRPSVQSSGSVDHEERQKCGQRAVEEVKKCHDDLANTN